MKVTELTIGSLVKTNKGKVIKVESISTKRQHRKLGYHEDNDPYHIKYVRITQVSPILLSEEMLKANGFTNTNICDEVRLKIKRPYEDITITYNSLMELFIDSFDGEWHSRNIFVRKVAYVHQLQIALHLCGLDELAENFKVNHETNEL